jgi:hypothetical protein
MHVCRRLGHILGARPSISRWAKHDTGGSASRKFWRFEINLWLEDMGTLFSFLAPVANMLIVKSEEMDDLNFLSSEGSDPLI